jgi:ferredoxin
MQLWSSVQQDVISVSLEKPLGMVLEEVEEGLPKGVFVLELSEEGSAAGSEFKDQLVGLKVATVMGEDVTSLAFDDVMDKLINAPSTVSLEFLSPAAETITEEEVAPQFNLGTPVTITVLEDGKETPIEAKVGDNLRKVLLENNIEVYKGMKQKLGNCGGGGQCTFCAADFVESEGWDERSDYEDQKLKKSPTARLSCLNNIQGPATIRL